MTWFRTFFVGVALALLAGALVLVLPDMEWNGGENHFDTFDEAAFMASLALLVVAPLLIGLGTLGCVASWFVERRKRCVPSN